ncbi:hypothetical protein [Paeniroseomonas aquatica]
MPESPRATTGGALPPRAVAVMLLLCLVWGLNLVAIKLGNAGIPPVLQAGLRSVIATAVLFGWCAWRGGGIGAALGPGGRTAACCPGWRRGCSSPSSSSPSSSGSASPPPPAPWSSSMARPSSWRWGRIG